jgi:hypothetical protein
MWLQLYSVPRKHPVDEYKVDAADFGGLGFYSDVFFLPSIHLKN